MSLADDLVKYAREERGTAWQHQGRLSGVALDCIGLVVIAARKAGLTIHDEFSYPRFPRPEHLLGALRAHCREITNHSEMREGDVLVFEVQGFPTHAGILTCKNTPMFIHSFQRDGAEGMVVEVHLDRFWRKRLTHVFRFEENK